MIAQCKTVNDSRTQQVEIILPRHTNGCDRLFGGQLMQWIDILAAVVARRHSQCEVTTARVDSLEFLEAAHVNATLFMEGCITYVGTTSMEVRVDTFVESLDGQRKQVNRAYLVLVALDENSKPVPVPRLLLQTDEERHEWEEALRRRKMRRA